MQKSFFAALVCALFVHATHAQVTTEAQAKLNAPSTDTTMGWKHGGVASLNLTQSSFTHWAAGGQNSVGVNALLNAYDNYKRGNMAWDNQLDIGYGELKQGNGHPVKTDDRFEFLSKYGLRAYKQWYYAFLLDFKTQLTPGYNYPDDRDKISDALSPAYLLLALGLNYKPNNTFDLFLSPITAKITYVKSQMLADRAAFGVDTGKHVRTEIGGYVRAQYRHNVMKNVEFQTKLELFSNYLKNPQNIDVNWENLLSLKVNKFLSATVNTQLVYDDDVKIPIDNNHDGIPEKYGPRTQFKEVIGVGLSYNF